MAAREVREAPAEEADPLALDYIFHPHSVAVVGVSPPQWGPAGVAAGFLLALQDLKFEGPIYPVNPHHQEILGLKCYPSLLDIPGPVDHVIFSVPTAAVPQVIEDCVAKRVKTIHFFTSGFSETGEAEAAEMERRIVARACGAGIRLIGPNCMGLYCPSGKIAFMPNSPVEPGPVGFLSQSGGNAGDVIFAAAPRGIRFSKIVSYGNAADLNECELLEYLAEDPETEIITAYIEGVRDGRRFFRALRRASARKPVVVLKGGRTDAGGRAVFSHTASLAGSAKVFDAVLRQAGAVRVDSVDELVDLAVGFRFIGPPAGRGMGVVGPGGGFSVFAADEVNEAGLELPDLSLAVQEELRRFTPVAGTSVRNPVDTNIIMEPHKLTDTLCIVASDPKVDAVLFHIGFGWGAWRRGVQQDQPLPFDPAMVVKAMADSIVRAKEAATVPVMLVIRSALDAGSQRFSLQFQEQCWRQGVGVFPSIPRACNAIAKMVRWREMRQDT
jgi:acyl-CoA synthetase (NDP forming)